LGTSLMAYSSLDCVSDAALASAASVTGDNKCVQRLVVDFVVPRAGSRFKASRAALAPGPEQPLTAAFTFTTRKAVSPWTVSVRFYSKRNAAVDRVRELTLNGTRFRGK
jgi:hypothetical protein